MALGRADIKRLSLSSEIFTNWMARKLGPMSLRVGTKYLGSSRANATARHLEFIFRTNDKAIVELTDVNMRVWVNDALITRLAVSSAVTNGNFDANIASWTDDDEVGGTSAWVTGGYLGLTGNGTAAAILTQQITVAAGDQNVEHALKIVIQRGPVIFRVGSTSGDDDYVTETTLDTGTHSLAFTPAGNFFIQFLNRLKRQVLVDSCNVEAAGVMTITSPFAEADLGLIRYRQSGDIIFIASGKTTDTIGYQQRKIERRATRSWSMVTYYSDDGPFDFTNDTPITIAASALSGNVTLTASKKLFRSSQVGALFRLTSSGQTVTTQVTAQNVFTNAIRVTGVGSGRVFTVTIDKDSVGGPFACTFTMQRSLESDVGPWTDVQQWTADATGTYDDTLTNQIAWYRLGVKTGDFTAGGTHQVTLTYTVGSITGVTRITAYTNNTTVSAEVLTELGGTTATDNWAESEWSSRRGYPTAVDFHEGRLWFAGKNGVWGSGSDNFYSFNDDQEGDSTPINRTIGSGPVDNVNWILSLSRLVLGADGSEIVCKSSSLDEILTPSNFNPRATSTQGSYTVGAVKVDKRGVFVTRGGVQVYEVAIEEDDYEYGSGDLTALIPEIGKPGIIRIAVQRQPDTRIHFVRSDGKVAILLIDKIEKVLCWLLYETDGTVEDVVITPGATGDGEDAVYYSVKRTIDSVTKRYLEKWALQSNCVGGTLNHQADCYYQYSGVATTTITGLGHLEAKSVVVWANGKDLGTYTVTGGQITGLTESVTAAIVGLTYVAQWKSTKLAHASIYGAEYGSTLTQKKNIGHLGAILADTHYQGLKYGRDFNNLDNLPLMMKGTPIAADTIHSTYDEAMFVFDGEWNTDSRICLLAQAPRPCTVLAIVFPVESHARI